MSDKQVSVVATNIDEIDAVQLGLDELKTKYHGAVFDMTTTSGADEARKARAAIRDPRYRVERARKDAKSKLAQLGKQIDERAGQITEALLELEIPIDNQIKAEEARKEAERQRKIMAEQQRQTALRASLAAIAEIPAKTSRDVDALRCAIAMLEEMQPSEAVFEEFIDQAVTLRARSLETLRATLAEEEAAQAQREELRRQQAELQAERERLDAERRKAEEAMNRVQRCHDEIRRVRQLGRSSGKSLDQLRQAEADLGSIKIDPMFFGELYPEMMESVQDAKVSIADGIQNALLREREAAERERAAAEKRERDAAEAKERERIEREKFEANKSEARAKRDAMFAQARSMRDGEFLDSAKSAPQWVRLVSLLEIATVALAELKQPLKDEFALALVSFGVEIDHNNL